MTKSQIKQDRHETKIRMAAFHYLNTSRDGAVICNLAGLTPAALNGIFNCDSGIWIEALRFWQRGYEGSGKIKGEYYHHAVMEASVKADMKLARVFWKYLFQNPTANRLRWYFNDLDEFGNEVSHDTE